MPQTFRYQLHLQWQYTNIQRDLQLSHVKNSSIFLKFDFNSLDLDLGQGHLNIFLSFSLKDSITTPYYCQICSLVTTETTFDILGASAIGSIIPQLGNDICQSIVTGFDVRGV